MPEWLTDTRLPLQHVAAGTLLLQLGAAILLGSGVALIYRWSHGRHSDNHHAMSTTLVLLSALIAMVSIVIGDSVARAFSLVGALSIVRFRTVVDDTRDTAFVIFAVIVGMASGAGLIVEAAIAMPVVGATAILLSRLARHGAAGMRPCLFTIRTALDHDPAAGLAQLLERHFSWVRPVSTGTARQGTLLETTYEVLPRSGESALSIVRELNETAGVVSVELRTS